MMIRCVDSKERIRSILEEFTPYLESLSTGKAAANQLASKYCEYGVVLEIAENHETAAFAAFYCNDEKQKTAYLSMIAVLPAFRQHGYGRTLIQEVKTVAKRNGMTKLRLEVRKKNIGAIRFYKTLGFHMLEEDTDASCFMAAELS